MEVSRLLSFLALVEAFTYSSAFLDCSDTPWDEPTSYSPEFAAYLTGELLTVPPWDRFGANALSEL